MGYESGRSNFVRVAIWEVLEAFMRIIILLFFLMIGIYFQWITIFWSLILAAPLTVLILNFSNLKKIKTISISKNQIQAINKIVKSIFPHAISVVVISFSVLILAYVLRLFAGNVGIEEISYMDAALVFYGIPRLFFSSIVRPIIPIVASKQTSKDKLSLDWRIYLLVLLIPIPLGFMIATMGVGTEIFALMNLSNYQPAAVALGILVGGSGVDLLFGYISSYLQGMNRTANLAFISILCLIPVFIGIWYLGESGNAQNAAIILTTYYIILTTAAACYFKVRYKS